MNYAKIQKKKIKKRNLGLQVTRDKSAMLLQPKMKKKKTENNTAVLSCSLSISKIGQKMKKTKYTFNTK